MRFRSLKKWSEPKKLEGLLLFAQVFEELLFTYSHDTYQPYAMNTATLAIEALRLINDIESGRLDKTNLKHVVEEFVESLKNDEVAKEIITLEEVCIIEKISSDHTTLHEKRIIFELVISSLKPSRYKNILEKKLTEQIETNKNKKNIIRYSRSYATVLITIGYSNRYIYNRTVDFFYTSKKNTISSVYDIKAFFEMFSFKDFEYKAVFQADSLFNEIKDTSNVFEIDISNEMPKIHIDNETSIDINFKKQDDLVYLVVSKVKARDVFAARDEAEKKLEHLSSLYNLFHHKKKLKWNDNAYLVNTETKFQKILSIGQSSMLMGKDYKPADAARKFNEFLKSFRLTTKDESFNKYVSAVELHTLALSSESKENQLLNLWIALETLVPSNIKSNSAKINNVLDGVIPLLCISYIESLTNQLLSDFLRWNKKIFKREINKIDGFSDREKLIKVLVLKEHGEIKNNLLKSLNDFVLLRNRAFELSEMLSSPQKVLKAIEKHKTRVSWQLRRVYRTRNMIVHVGFTPHYINVLIKNLHSYLDTVLFTIAEVSDGAEISSLGQAFRFKYYIFESNLKNLKACSCKDIGPEYISLLTEL